MNIIFEKKFADKNIDNFIDKIYKNLTTNQNDSYIFDLSNTEFIGNQELLVLSALFKSFYESKIDFKVHFFKLGKNPHDLPERVQKQIIQFWETWKIWKIIEDADFKKYFGIDSNAIERLEEELDYFPRQSELYTWFGITPFIVLDFIENYNENSVKEKIEPCFKLNSVINELLKLKKCSHPFTSYSLSTIITEELYLNFLDHTTSSCISKFPNNAFMSISLQDNLNPKNFTKFKIEETLKTNFEEEAILETKSFFFNENLNKYLNRPFILFTFLDFSHGIPSTLKNEYLNNFSFNNDKDIESQILKYAFEFNSSRHPILDEKNNINKSIPRGLFDVLTIAKRYKGMLIVRSGQGKIIYNFTDTDEIEESFSTFGNCKEHFMGTLLSLYIPAINDEVTIDTSTIKPKIIFSEIKPNNKKYITLNSILEGIGDKKEFQYSLLTKTLKEQICSNDEATLVLFSFKNCELVEKRILKKALYFLLTDYNINLKNNVLIIDSPSNEILNEVDSELLTLSSAIQNYKIHPLPIIEFKNDSNNTLSENISLRWLGVYEEKDKNKLNELLYEQYSITKGDFLQPYNVSGQLIDYDKFNNLLSNVPKKNELLNFYLTQNQILSDKELFRLLTKHSCLKSTTSNSIYLCTGNYYQKEFLQLNSLINDKVDCAFVSTLLFENLRKDFSDLNDVIFLSITPYSQKILKSLINQGLISKKDVITIDNISNFDFEFELNKLEINKKYILIGEILSTGFQVESLNSKLKKAGVEINHVGVIISTFDDECEFAKPFLNKYRDRITALYKQKIKKYTRSEIKNDILEGELIRINPYSNLPITFSISETNYNNSIIFKSNVTYDSRLNTIEIQNLFLDNIEIETIKIGFLKFNNLVHPYFFDTSKILEKFKENSLKFIFDTINNQNFAKNNIYIFYPRNSNIENLNLNSLKHILKNHSIEINEIERISTNEGWKFPHNSELINEIDKDKMCLILDDGSCSGDSLIQMLDEIAFFNFSEIILLCFIGRINDFKREFFSRLSGIKVKEMNPKPISIYFITHWHIPTYYSEDNPNIKETKWLDEVLNLQNTPRGIKKISLRIKDLLISKSLDDFSDYKNFPKFKNSNTVPKKEILLVREELGKVIGYRLYKESFIFFNYFIKKYTRQIDTNDRYKEIELLCATFIYEPYLYDKMSIVLPDVAERIEAFVDILLFSNEKIITKLTYDWDEKDIVHLFFIVFKGEKLISKLDESNIIKIITFTKNKNATINYIFYKLLSYLPLKESDLNDKYLDLKIKALLENLKNQDFGKNKQFKKYVNFIATLPSREDFNSQIQNLKTNYEKNVEQQYHDEKISFNHNISQALRIIRELNIKISENNVLEEESIIQLRSIWFDILNLINPILAFSISYKEFLEPYPYFKIINQMAGSNNSLREMVGFNEDVIFNLDQMYSDKNKLKILERNILKIQSNFGNTSDFYNLIKNRTTGIEHIINTLIIGLEEKKIKIEILNCDLDNNIEVNIPLIYSNMLICKELITNIVNHGNVTTDELVFIKISNNISEVSMEIKNKIAKSEHNNSNGEGLKCLTSLSNWKYFGFKYNSEILDLFYKQTLTFKII